MGLAAASVALALTLVAQDRTANLPLLITQTWIETDDRLPAGMGFPRVEVLNTGNRTILAWHLRYVLMLPNGSTVGNSGFGVDSASVLPEDRTTSVAPRRTVHNSGGGAFVPADATFTDTAITFVIFDDDTALGNQREIDYYFSRRRARQVFWQRMLTIFNDATSRETDPSTVLSRIRERMEAESDPTFREGPYYNEILARMSARRMEPAGTTPQQVLDNLRTTITAQKANADAHAVRR